MNEDSLKEQLSREADMIVPGPAPTSSVEQAVRGRRRRNLIAAGTGAGVLAAAVAIGSSQLSGSDGDGPVAADAPDASAAISQTSGAPGRIVATSHVDASLKQYYPKIADLLTSPAANAIVTGTITDVSYESAEGIASTILTVNVSRNLYGKTAQTIKVHEDGGYLPASEVIAELKQKDPTVEPTLDPKGFVDVQFEGAAHPLVGDSVVLVLTNDPNPGREGDYMEVSSVYGRFTLNKAGTYQRTGDGEGFQTTTDLPSLQALAKSRS
ncbi:MAG: hypothetical protein QM572_01630 [Nocardioides sp.]|uniref:hypothetical protein n=1 Tax=Nocardioides sp. TaxID=35761 RepID=UPI0039E570EC